MKSILINPATYPIQPKDLDLSAHPWGTFGNRQAEISARWIAEFCKTRHGWEGFTLSDLEAFYHQSNPGQSFMFNGLDEQGLIVLQGDTYRLTHEFISAYFHAHPQLAA